MSFSRKIDEWLKEAEARPESAVTIVKLVARRLHELSERNEELLAENIALQNGTRVEEFQKRIAHLEYQLEILRRRFGSGTMEVTSLPSVQADVTTMSLLLYNSSGRILRLELDAEARELGRLGEEALPDNEQPRLLAVPTDEEVLLLFTSGRVGTFTAGSLPPAAPGGMWTWDQAAQPDEPRAGEFLACVMPFSRLPVSEYFLQVSRRGCVKKTPVAMGQSILENRYLGRGTVQKLDQPFDASLCLKSNRLAFVTLEGKLLGLDVDELSYSAEDRIRLTASDYVIAAFVPEADESLLFLTQTGKVIHRESGSLELARSPLAKGQALIPPARLEQGVRFIGAASARGADRIAVLDSAGDLRLHTAGDILGAGSVEARGLLLAIARIPAGENS